MKTNNMLTLALLIIGSLAAAQTQMDPRLRPSGPTPKLTISAECRPKLIVASDAVREINVWESEREYQGARQDAKHALREAHAAVLLKGDNAVLGDIEMHLAVKELCRVMRQSECDKVGVEWSVRIQTELISPPQPKVK